MDDIGLRFYSLDYLEGLLEVKIGEMKLGFPWLMLRGQVLPVMERFFENGLFVVRVLDKDNYTAVMASFLENKDIDVGVRVEVERHPSQDVVRFDGKVHGSTENKIRLLTQARARELFKKDVERRNMNWLDVQPVVTKLVDKFYGDQLIFGCADAVNKTALITLLNQDSDFDIPVRLRVA